MFLPTIKVAKQVGQKPPDGHFSVEKDELTWQRCREQFASSFIPSTTGFYFSHPENVGETVASFIERTEEVVEFGLNQAIPRSNFSKTNFNFALWVEPSNFWKNCEMRRSLFTIFLRCGLKYDPSANNYDEALNSQEYVKKTKDAIFRFLFGFTEYVNEGVVISGVGKGWVTQFERKTIDQLRGRLVRPSETKDSCLVGAGLLWG